MLCSLFNLCALGSRCAYRFCFVPHFKSTTWSLPFTLLLDRIGAHNTFDALKSSKHQLSKHRQKEKRPVSSALLLMIEADHFASQLIHKGFFFSYARAAVAVLGSVLMIQTGCHRQIRENCLLHAVWGWHQAALNDVDRIDLFGAMLPGGCVVALLPRSADCAWQLGRVQGAWSFFFLPPFATKQGLGPCQDPGLPSPGSTVQGWRSKEVSGRSVAHLLSSLSDTCCVLGASCHIC